MLTWDNNGGDNQKWQRDNEYIVSGKNGKVLSIMTTNDQGRLGQVTIWDKEDDNDGQK